MLNVNKRFAKVLSGSLAAVMLNFALFPTMVFAAHHHHHQPPHHHVRSYQSRHYRPVYHQPHHHSHHHHYHDRWTKHDTASLAGLVAVIGLLALANKKRQDRIVPAESLPYAAYNNQAKVEMY